MKNKLFLSLICGVLVLGLVTGCGNNQTNNNNDLNGSSNNGTVSSENSTGYKVKVNNNTFTFPCKFEEFQKAGYSMKDADIQKVLSSTKDYEYIYLYDVNDRYQYDLFPINVKPNGNNIKDAIVFGIYMNDIWETSGVQLYIEDLEIGKATIEDVENKLGKPDYTEPTTYSEDNISVLFIYDEKEDSDWELTIAFRSGVLNQVKLMED